MKKSLIIASLGCLTTLTVLGQGTVNFDNYAANNGAGAPVFDVNGTTPLAGTAFSAQLYGGIAGTADGSLVTEGASLPFATAGYFNTASGATRSVTGVAGGGTARLQVRAWKVSTGATWEAATTRGESTSFDQVLGGAGSPPSQPTNMLNMRSFSLHTVVPEPSTFALGALGLGALLFRRRSKVSA